MYSEWHSVTKQGPVASVVVDKACQPDRIQPPDIRESVRGLDLAD